MNPSTDPTSQVLEHGSDETSDETPQEVWRRLDSMSQLLHQAARTVWARADVDGPTSPLHSLGLGIYLAHGQTLLLLPEDLSDRGDGESDLELDVDELDVRTAVQLLTEVEELSRPLPVWRADLVHGSQLVVDVCDLLREAQHLDW
ncbi:MAG: hypothetical protein OSB43_19550 [Nocardioides sp.]|uniref:hypothetical protein n=1 Tax=Nocardioides sp. TaxID=35761 RepID=UPI00239D415D|nr:hypothetical protein [Nocardioides sp.]MDE0778483.1 hypothetical protein [Nocardioides sp.]